MIETVSVRRQDLARLLVNGASREEISRTVGLKVGTLKKQIGNIFRNLSAQNRAEVAILLAEWKGGSRSLLPVAREPLG